MWLLRESQLRNSNISSPDLEVLLASLANIYFSEVTSPKIFVFLVLTKILPFILSATTLFRFVPQLHSGGAVAVSIVIRLL